MALPQLMLRCKRWLPAGWLTVLTYHRVCERDASGPWDSDVVSATPEQFRRQLEFVGRYFTPITSEQIVLWKEGRLAKPANPIVLTFDDGYRDCHDVVLPLLLEAGVVADFFVCPWNIEERRLFWWDKIACCLRKSSRDSIVLKYPRRLELNLSTRESIELSLRAIGRIIRHTDELDVDRLVDELQEAAAVDFDEQAEADKLLMNWDQVRALRRAGMGVGSHSYSHRILPLTKDDTAREEMARSKSAIEEALNESVLALAYPVGAFDKNTKRMAEQAGYRLAYSYCSGASRLRSGDPFEIKRIAVEEYMSLPYFRTMVAIPFLT